MLDGCGCCSLLVYLFFFKRFECSLARCRRKLKRQAPRALRREPLTDAAYFARVTCNAWIFPQYHSIAIPGCETDEPIANNSNNHHFYIKCAILPERVRFGGGHEREMMASVYRIPLLCDTFRIVHLYFNFTFIIFRFCKFEEFAARMN